jgi:hypothetical protein
VIAAVRVASADLALFLDVHDFPVRGYLAVLAHHAAASEGREAEQPNETHHVSSFWLQRQQHLYLTLTSFLATNAFKDIGRSHRALVPTQIVP